MPTDEIIQTDAVKLDKICTRLTLAGSKQVRCTIYDTKLYEKREKNMLFMGRVMNELLCALWYPRGRDRKRVKMLPDRKKVRKSVCSKKQSEFLPLLFEYCARALEVKHITFKLKNRSHISRASFGGCGVISFSSFFSLSLSDLHIGHMSTFNQEAFSTVTLAAQWKSVRYFMFFTSHNNSQRKWKQSKGGRWREKKEEKVKQCDWDCETG